MPDIDDKKRKVVRLVFRMPANVKSSADEFATGTCRSLNDALIYLVKRGLEAENISAKGA